MVFVKQSATAISSVVRAKYVKTEYVNLAVGVTLFAPTTKPVSTNSVETLVKLLQPVALVLNA